MVCRVPILDLAIVEPLHRPSTILLVEQQSGEDQLIGRLDQVVGCSLGVLQNNVVNKPGIAGQTRHPL